MVNTEFTGFLTGVDGYFEEWWEMGLSRRWDQTAMALTATWRGSDG